MCATKKTHDTSHITYQGLLDGNEKFIKNALAADPDFFNKLSVQNPPVLWIGCADSRVPANQITNTNPGEIFVHRNIANMVIHTDMNMLSVLDYAVNVLQVKHVIVTGHYGCGGVLAAMDDKRHGLIDNWLRHIQDTASLYEDYLSTFADQEARFDKLCELNIIEQVINVAETTILQDAWAKGQEVSVHGLIYDLGDGILRDLNVTVERQRDRRELRQKFLSAIKAA